MKYPDWKKIQHSAFPKRRSRKPCPATKEDLDQAELRILKAIKAPADAELRKFTKHLAKSADALQAAVERYSPKI